MQFGGKFSDTLFPPRRSSSAFNRRSRFEFPIATSWRATDRYQIVDERCVCMLSKYADGRKMLSFFMARLATFLRLSERTECNDENEEINQINSCIDRDASPSFFYLLSTKSPSGLRRWFLRVCWRCFYVVNEQECVRSARILRRFIIHE